MDSGLAAELVIGPATSGRTRWRRSGMADYATSPAIGFTPALPGNTVSASARSSTRR
jgi:hypothetical protein